MIKIEKLTKKYNGESKELYLYKNLDFEIKSGDFIAILGRSGSGKTSLLNMIAGIVGFDSGEIIINKNKLSKLSNDQLTKFRGKNMSFIFQQFHLIQNLTVKENIELAVDINNIKTRFTTEEILKKVGLEDKINSYPFNLSGGEQQRVAIARAFLGETPILLADEPTGNLDENNAKKIMEILTNMHKEAKNTIILITHDKKVASYANKAYEIKDRDLCEIKL